MTISNFITLANTCAPEIHPTTLSAIVMQESRGNVHAIGINGKKKLSRQPSTRKEAIAIAEQLKRNGYNFDVGLGQINVKNLAWLGMSLSDLFDPCKNLKAMQIVLTHCYERATSKYSPEQKALRAALSCYNTGNFERGFTNAYVQKVVSHVGVKVPELIPMNDNSQEFEQLSTTTQEKMIVADPSATSKDKPIDAFTKTDAFTHKANSIRDAFTTENSFTVRKYRE
ncbi:lytic transglycosylase domain-containing protein [Bartonella sp. B41]